MQIQKMQRTPSIGLKILERLYQENPYHQGITNSLINAYIKQNNYKEAINTANNITNLSTRYEKLAQLYFQNKDWKSSLNFWNKFLQLNQDIEQEKFKYGKVLLSMSLLEEASQFFREMIDTNFHSMFGWYGWGLAQKAFNHNKLAYICFNKALEYAAPNYKIDIILAMQETCSRLEYYQLIDKLKNQYPYEVRIWLKWASLSVEKIPLAKLWLIKKQRLEYLLTKFPDDLSLLIQYGNILLNTNYLVEAEKLFQNLVDKHPFHQAVHQGFCLSAYFNKSWELANKRFIHYYRIYPNDIEGIFYFYLVSHMNLHGTNNNIDFLSEFIDKKYKTSNNHKLLNKLQANLAFSNYKKSEEIKHKIDIIYNTRRKIKFYNDFDSTIETKFYLNNPKSDTLLILFSGL